jgi:hypothetical protein
VQQQQRQQQQHLSVLPVPVVGDHIEASTLLPALQQLLSVYKVSYCASSTSTSAVIPSNYCWKQAVARVVQALCLQEHQQVNERCVG